MSFVDPLASFARGQSLVTDFANQQGQRQAAQGLASGNYAQALGALGGMGDINGAIAVQNAQAQGEERRRSRVTEERTRNVAIYRQALDAIKTRAGSEGGAVQAFDEVAPYLRVTGVSDEELTPLRQALAADPTRAIGTLEAALGREEMEIRDGGGGDVVGINKRTGESRLLYDAPDRPTFIPGVGFLLPPGQASQGVPGVNPPVTGSQIQPGALWERQEQQESGGRQFRDDGSLLTSPKGAFGVAQLMPGTAADLAREMGVTVEELQRSPELNRAAGQRYQAQQLERYNGNEALALAAYNAGPGRVDEWIRTIGDPRKGEVSTEEFVSRIPFAETRNYVQNITQGQYGEEQGSDVPQNATESLGGGWQLQPFESASDRRADRAESRAERADARAERAAQRAEAGVVQLSPSEVAALGLPEGTVAQRQPNGAINVVSRGGTERFTEGQRNAAYFYHRLAGARDTMRSLRQRGIVRPSPAILAFGEGRIRENALGENDRLWLQAARNWLAPILRKDTGAAITAPEVVYYMGEYLASPTDSDAVIRQKEQSQRRAEESLRGLAGGAYDNLLEELGLNQSSNRRPRTNAPGLRFNISQPQLETRQRIVGSGGRPSAALGSAQNPYYINPADPNASFSNVRRGGYFVTPDGQIRGPKP